MQLHNGAISRAYAYRLCVPLVIITLALLCSNAISSFINVFVIWAATVDIAGQFATWLALSQHLASFPAGTVTPPYVTLCKSIPATVYQNLLLLVSIKHTFSFSFVKDIQLNVNGGKQPKSDTKSPPHILGEQYLWSRSLVRKYHSTLNLLLEFLLLLQAEKEINVTNEFF